MSESRRGLLAAGLAAAVVGSMGVVWTLNANADETPAASSPTVVTTTTEAADAPEASASADDPGTDTTAPVDATDAETPPPAGEALAVPPKLLPWGAKPTRMKRGKAGASSAAVAAAGADAAPADQSGRSRPVPEYAPKGRTSRTSTVKKSTTTVVPPAPPNVKAPRNDVFYNYAKGSQTGETDGSWANLGIAKPTVGPGDYHSLAEISVQSGGDNPNVVEVGWTVDRSVNGDDDPHLFVFYWKNGIPTCYNACGYRQYSTTVKPGDTLPADVPKRFGVVHSGNNWWIAYNSEYIGYFPDSLWDGDYTRANFVQWFGEVASSTTTPCTDMGNGLLPSSGGATRAGSLAMTNGPDAKVVLQSDTPHPAWYDVALVTDKTFRFGGPGADLAVGCQPIPSPSTSPSTPPTTGARS
ncbi:neprosin family prolyl endopeptidase [Actinoplanes sp. TFC3]|uniref:neprosin family prolyl endopeptidase n=1 Tax=Actinoplanes sp. TFC3 TaxID=1710355 RepID=UPI00082DA11E|nr:neprosin family prolyl endopeptidase [Actinoplanes sp. TFC3]